MAQTDNQPPRTQSDRLCAALVAHGCAEVESNSRKYRTFKPTVFRGTPGTLFFVGKMGALRYGVTASNSFSASDGFKAKLVSGVPMRIFCETESTPEPSHD